MITAHFLQIDMNIDTGIDTNAACARPATPIGRVAVAESIKRLQPSRRLNRAEQER